MSDFFDSIEDVSVEKKEGKNNGHIFTLRLDIESRSSELCLVNWEKVLRTSIESAVYKDLNINYSIEDLSERQDEHKFYDRLILVYKIFVYSEFKNVYDCCMFLDSLNVQKGRYKNEMTHTIHYLGTDGREFESLYFSFDYHSSKFDEESGKGSTEIQIEDIVCLMLYDIAAHPTKEITHYFHFINSPAINHLIKRHDCNMFYQMSNNFENQDDILYYTTSAFDFALKDTTRNSTLLYIPSQRNYKSFKKLFYENHSDLTITISLQSYFTNQANNTTMFRYSSQSYAEIPYHYFFKYISQLSARTFYNNNSYYKFHEIPNNKEAMITMYAGDIYVPEIDDILLTSISIYGPEDSVIEAVKKIYG